MLFVHDKTRNFFCLQNFFPYSLLSQSDDTFCFALVIKANTLIYPLDALSHLEH